MRLFNSVALIIFLMHTSAHTQELTLAEGLAIIATSGRDVMISRAAVDAAKGGVETARAPYFPEVTRYEAHQRDTKARYTVGVVTKNDLLRAEVVLADSRQRLLIAENARSIRASRVNSLLERPLNDDVSPAEPQAAPAAAISLTEAWTVAATENPEIRDLVGTR